MKCEIPINGGLKEMFYLICLIIIMLPINTNIVYDGFNEQREKKH